MSAIPEDADDFQDPEFWKEFYKDSKNAFEWYGDFKTFGRVLSKYLKSTDKILQIGCGSSELASQLYDSGYRIIDSIDTDEGVIQKQTAENSSSRPELQFSCSSAAKIDASDEKYNVVLDKGTLDSLLPSACNNMVEDVEKMFAEICRVLTIGGRYIILTLAQNQVLSTYMSFFLKRKNFIIRVEKNIDTNYKFPLPVFLFIATKLRVSLPSPYMELILSTEKKSVKFTDPVNLISAVNAEQEFSRFRHLCSKKLDEEVSIILHGDNEKPRYRIAVHDDPEVTVLSSFAVFIVPVGRDHDWFFATEKGRSSLRKQCCKDRLAVVTLFRDQKYENMEQVKDELGPYVIQLTPASLRQTRKSVVEFLSLGKIDVKETRATGDSDVNGPWAVEDVRIQNSLYRRLVFLSAQNLVQSEVKLIRNRKGREIVDLHTLTSEYHEAMLAALPFMLPPCEKLSHSTKSRLLVLGLGGGVLPSFLHLKFPSMFVVAVELDQKIAEIATHWFSFNSDSHLTVVIKDALTYVEELVQQKNQSLLFDAIFVDVAGSTQKDGLSCPLPSFVTEEALKKMYAALHERGVLALNLVTRNDDIAEQIKDRILSIFSYYYSYCTEEDINQVLICPKVRKGLFEARRACENYKKEKGTLRNLFANISELKFYEKRAN
ncbi:methyltransferase domain protein [Onchocerca flexuosa]|uniref:Methyltransferase domain protein n=1 Tax=Onchocerca flexuosa TaxID=387005 RepID=A0A238C0K3_9BILA|nr:methyltransferase domain protein [Onchocerca flexuosa]